MISEGSVEEERTPDLRRMERIRWPAPVIEHSDDGVIKVWRNQRRRNETRILLWLEELDYLVHHFNEIDVCRRLGRADANPNMNH